MATNRPLQNLISTTGNPATRSSSSLVTPQLAALADPPTHTADARLLNWLVAETIKTLRESELAATTRQDRDLYAAQRHVESLRLSVPTSRGAAAEEEQPPPVCRTEPDETAVRARLDVIGYRVGWATAERLARDRPRFPLAANPTPSSAPPAPSSSQSTPNLHPTPQLDTLELVKFICKDVWISLFDKQVDNLRTNHRGVYVVSDNALASLRGLSPVPVPSATTTTAAAAATGRHEEIIDEEAEEERNQLQDHVEAVLAFPSGIIRGALAQLGIASLVSGTADLSTLPQASFQIKTGAAAFPPAPPPPPSVAPTSTAGAGRTSTPIATASAAAGGTTGISTSAAASAVSSRGGTPVVPASSSSSSSTGAAAASASPSFAPAPR